MHTLHLFTLMLCKIWSIYVSLFLEIRADFAVLLYTMPTPSTRGLRRYSECACLCVALFIQYEKRMCSILLSYVAYLFFSYYPIKSPIFGKSHRKTTSCLDFLYNFYLKYLLALRIIQKVIIINVQRSSCKVPVILARF